MGARVHAWLAVASLITVASLLSPAPLSAQDRCATCAERTRCVEVALAAVDRSAAWIGSLHDVCGLRLARAAGVEVARQLLPIVERQEPAETRPRRLVTSASAALSAEDETALAQVRALALDLTDHYALDGLGNEAPQSLHPRAFLDALSALVALCDTAVVDFAARDRLLHWVAVAHRSLPTDPDGGLPTTARRELQRAVVDALQRECSVHDDPRSNR